MFSTRQLVTLVLLAALGGCSGSGYASAVTGPTGTTTGATNAIAVADNSFTPSTANVTPGTTVTWTWKGTRQHSVTFDDGATSATQSSGTYQRSFSAAGSYSYHCTIHGTAMSGVVVVK